MSTSPPLNARPSQPPRETSTVQQVANVRALNALAVRGLVPMFDTEKQLFCHRLVRTDCGFVREGFSPRYTIMTLLGLHELERSGGGSPFDTEAIYKSFVNDTRWIGGIGDLGLLVWLGAAFAPQELGSLFHRMEVESALDRYADAREGRTTELAWFLAGLAHAAIAGVKKPLDLTDLAVETYHRLAENQGEYGLFGHMNRKKSIAGFLRGRIGSFADQIYPVYAMSKFATAFGVEEPLGSALACATVTCGAQGKLGQWWWLYESRTGRVASRYPVYAVHQQGMAPMALFALQQATGQCFETYIYKGLQWIYGANELEADMRDLDANLIWRCILPRNGETKYIDTAMSLLRAPKADASVGPRKRLFEDRPYELGWLLYAFGEAGLPEL